MPWPPWESRSGPWSSWRRTEGRDLPLLFKDLATLRTNDLLFTTVDELEWRGPADGFAAWAERIGDAGLRRVAGNARRPVLGQDQG